MCAVCFPGFGVRPVGLVVRQSRITTVGELNLNPKGVPQHTNEGGWGRRGYTSYSFSNSALDGSELSASRPGRALALRKGPPVPVVQEIG
jgi:hypothetical protein